MVKIKIKIEKYEHLQKLKIAIVIFLIIYFVICIIFYKKNIVILKVILYCIIYLL